MGRMMEMGPAFEQVAEIFFYDLPYVFALPVSFLLLAILLVYVSRDTALRGIYCAIIQFLVTFMLWITMNSHIIHAVLKAWAEWLAGAPVPLPRADFGELCRLCGARTGAAARRFLGHRPLRALLRACDGGRGAGLAGLRCDADGLLRPAAAA